jgi:hypothetical protein
MGEVIIEKILVRKNGSSGIVELIAQDNLSQRSSGRVAIFTTRYRERNKEINQKKEDYKNEENDEGKKDNVQENEWLGVLGYFSNSKFDEYKYAREKMLNLTKRYLLKNDYEIENE